MVILENIDIDKAILQNIDIDKISNRFKFGISNRAIRRIQPLANDNPKDTPLANANDYLKEPTSCK